MCGRFANIETEQTLKATFKVSLPPGQHGHNRMPRYNISPGVEIETVINAENSRHITMMHWGFSLGQMPRPVINARGETIFEKPSFAALARGSRCLVMATGWYEWKAPRQPYFIRHADYTPMAMAGLYRKTETGFATVVVTRQAAGRLGDIHHRAPLILDDALMEAWLDPESREADLKGIITATEGEGLEWVPVSAEVGQVRADHAGLIVADETHGKPLSPQLDLF